MRRYGKERDGFQVSGFRCQMTDERSQRKYEFKRGNKKRRGSTGEGGGTASYQIPDAGGGEKWELGAGRTGRVGE
jgi:hypothetical protein